MVTDYDSDKLNSFIKWVNDWLQSLHRYSNQVVGSIGKFSVNHNFCIQPKTDFVYLIARSHQTTSGIWRYGDILGQ